MNGSKFRTTQTRPRDFLTPIQAMSMQMIQQDCCIFYKRKEQNNPAHLQQEAVSLYIPHQVPLINLPEHDG